MSDAVSTLRAYVEEVELWHVRAQIEGLTFCRSCYADWPCDAARGAAAIRAMLPFLEDGPGRMCHTHSRELLDAGAAALGGK